jgi:methyl-accepting chemotaxis protein
MSVQKRLVKTTLAVVVVGLALSTIAQITLSVSRMTEAREAEVRVTVRQRTEEMRVHLERAAASARAAAAALKTMRDENIADRRQANAIVKGALVSNPMLIGASTAWEPNAFDGRDAEFVNADPVHDETGRLIPWWYRAGNKIGVEKLIDYEKPGDGDWYLEPRRQKHETIMEPYLYPVEGKQVLMTTISVPIMEGDRFLGITTVDIPLDDVSEMLAKTTLLRSGWVALLTASGKVVAHPDKSLAGKEAEQAGFPADVVQAVQNAKAFRVEHGDDLYVVEPFQPAGASTQWSLVARVPLQELHEGLWTMVAWGIGLALIGMALVSVAIVYELRRLVLRPLGGEPSDVTEIVRRIANKDLESDRRSTQAHPDSLMGAALAMRDQLREIIQRIRTSADQVASASAEIAQGNQDLSARTESAAASLEQTTASTQHLTETVKNSAQAAALANQLAAQAAQVARDGGQTVAQAVQSMKAIELSSQKIADITNVIDGIAFQTNILALNAAVEAARAGEAGRGFAVVAGEVRSLAQRSAEAAKQIKALIDESVATVRTGSTQVDSAGQTMEQIVQSIQRVADMIAEVTAAANEQSESIAQVNAALGQLDQTTQQNAALVEEAAAAAQSLRQQAAELQQVVSQFRTGASGTDALPTMRMDTVRTPLDSHMSTLAAT